MQIWKTRSVRKLEGWQLHLTRELLSRRWKLLPVPSPCCSPAPSAPSTAAPSSPGLSSESASASPRLCTLSLFLLQSKVQAQCGRLVPLTF